MLKRILLTLLVGLLSLPASSAGAAVGDTLTPNLKAYPATDLTVVRSGNKTLLRFSTLSGNVSSGAAATAKGPLELRAGEVSRATKKQKVHQRVYLEGGGFTDRLVGEFQWHQAHQHFHFENYAHYTLQQESARGASQRVGTKTSFCIMDTTLIDGTAPAAYSTCGSQVQGMSLGWGDRYGYQLAGQEIDVTGLPADTYRLRIVIDPLGRLQEASTEDNVSELLIRLSPADRTVQVL